MSIQEKFEEEMLEICEKYYELDKERDAIEDQLEHLHEYMEITLKKYNKDVFDHDDSPVRVKRLVYTSERMKRGGKDKLKEILTEEQWDEIFDDPMDVERIRVTPKKKE